ncbi:high-affinity iron transporter [Hyphomicrobium sp. 1Nfss2.1]|uniref:FTR1 family protein n=1 Tax=Hyphomicrobium sp. 1Nfss2.1 TaxID=3413936 RepID=UPI003C7BAC9E
MASKLHRLIFQTIIALLVICSSLAARADDNSVQTVWRLLDYIAVDYAGAVSGGAVTNEAEYAEQVEFADTARAKIESLPQRPAQNSLIKEADRLKQAITGKSDPAEVARIAHQLAAALLAAYPVPLAPNAAPSLERGAALYKESCASCHGETGDGHGPQASSLETPPIAFTDGERARQRSIFALYQVITQGIDGTPMPSFASLSAQDRWALAFYAGHFASDSQAAEGEQLWNTDEKLHALIPDLKALTGMTPTSLADSIDAGKADAVMAYLRLHPEAVASAKHLGSLTALKDKLQNSLKTYEAGDHKQAGQLALSAYLDHFEPVEPTLGARDSALLGEIERGMMEYRAAIARGESAQVLAERVTALNGLFDSAEAVLAPNAGSPIATFLGAATILLREGLEAMLIVVAMIAFLRKAERTEVLPHVHAGWVGGLVAGLLTWAAATWLIEISGASRELTEGFGSIFAALVLLSVGIWMHGKSHADQWQRYIREKMSTALSGRSAWVLFGLAFVAVYREVFETILFYATLWTQGNGGAMLAGAATACVALALIAWAMLRYAGRLPIGQFFRYSSWLMAVLTVVLAGKGVAALQEAGIIGIAPLAAMPRIPIVGVFPTVQTVAAQVAMVAALAVGFRLNTDRPVSPQN